MAELETVLATAIATNFLIPKASRVLVAVSGGLDSVCLLHCLWQLSRRDHAFELVVGHLDHGLRVESRCDADFVAQLCARLGLPFHGRRVDVQALAQQSGAGIEEAGRDARRQFLLEVAAASQCQRIALAHHREDQAETVLLRMVRGCGVSGLAAMQWRNGLFIRPLLEVARQQLEAYAKDSQLEWLEDASNQQLRFSRNRIRHRVLPELRKLNPKVAGHFCRLAERVAVEESFWEQQVQRLFDQYGQCAHDGHNELRVSCVGVCDSHPALRARLFRYCLQRVRGDLRGIEQVHIRLIDSLLDGAVTQRRLDLPGAWVARRYNELVFRQRPPVVAENVWLEIPCPGCYTAAGYRFEVRLADSAQGESRWRVEFAAEAVHFPLLLRSPRPGDRMHCSGMVGRKKIKAVLAENHIESERRATTLVLESGSQLLWLVGVRRSNCAEVCSESAVVISVAVQPAIL